VIELCRQLEVKFAEEIGFPGVFNDQPGVALAGFCRLGEEGGT
jgi:hypothetical protein